LHYP